MKKAFTKVLIALTILCTGTISTSCDSETIGQLLPLITSLLNTGETYLYTGQGNSQSLTGSYAQGRWTALNSSPYNYSTMQVQLVCKETGTLTIQAFNEGDVAVSEITLSELSLTPNDDETYTILDLTENSCISGDMTVNGVTYTACSIYPETLAATPEEIALKMTVYFQAEGEEDYTKAVNFTFTGKVATE